MSRPPRLSLRLDKRTARAVAAGHPWIYADSLEAAGLRPRPGDEVDVLDSIGAFLGRALAEGRPTTGPALRVFTQDPRDPPVGKLLFRRLAAAARLRDRVLPPDTDAYRLLHGEGDALPGLVVDRYDFVAVVRPDGELWRPHLPRVAEAIRSELPAVKTVLLRPKDGEPRTLSGPEPPDELVVTESGRRYLVRPGFGQKTGFFLDQRPNRDHVQRLARPGDRVLNLFSFTGGFSLAAALGGASEVTSVDLAESILEDARRQFPLNDLDPDPHRFVAADVFAWLPEQARRREPRPWDLVICDPPALARSTKDLPAARAAYRRLHEALASAVAPEGLLVTASCTARLGPDELLEDATDGLRAGGRRVTRVLRTAGAGEDHPVPPAFPQGRYLSCLTLALD